MNSSDKIRELADNNILMLVGALNKEFGARDNWPTNTAGLELTDFMEVMVNAEIMRKLNDPDAGTDSAPKPDNEYLEQVTPDVDSTDNPTPKQREIRRKRQEQFRKFNKRYKT